LQQLVLQLDNILASVPQSKQTLDSLYDLRTENGLIRKLQNQITTLDSHTKVSNQDMITPLLKHFRDSLSNSTDTTPIDHQSNPGELILKINELLARQGPKSPGSTPSPAQIQAITDDQRRIYFASPTKLVKTDVQEV
jgi:hypothetical protein